MDLIRAMPPWSASRARRTFSTTISFCRSRQHGSAARSSAPAPPLGVRIAGVDTGGPGATSWFFYAPEIADVIDDLASAPFGARMDDTQYVVFPGAFMVRATGVSNN